MFANASSASDSGAYATLKEEYTKWYTSPGTEIYIDTTIDDAKDEYNPGPAGVFINDTHGYVFYIDAASDNVAYRNTTDGGSTWNDAVSISTDRNFNKVAIWYDQWTPGGTGDKIHIARLTI